MESLLLSNPTTFSPPFLPQKGNLKDAMRRTHPLGFRTPKEGRRVGCFKTLRCSMDVSLGGSYNYEHVQKFPRMRVWNPYKRLGVTRDASEEEIRGARNFLLEQYAGHEGSVESVEAAYDKIIMTSFRLRKKAKINLKSRLRNKVEESPPWFKTLLSYFEVPPVDVILRRLFLFAFMGVWSIMNSAENGPAFQVALSLGSCIFFLNDKMKNVPRAAIIGFGALAVGWIVGSILIPMVPTVLLRPTWSLELLTSLVSYVFMFLACTFIK